MIDEGPKSTTEWALTEIASALTRIADHFDSKSGIAAGPTAVPNAVRQPSPAEQYGPPRAYGDGKKPNWWGMLYHRAKDAGLNCDALSQEHFGIASSKQLNAKQCQTLLDLPELKQEQ